MVTARNEDCEDHQVGAGEQSALGLVFGTRCGVGDGTQVFAARQVAQMVAANAGQAGDLFLGEDFLTRLDCDHFLPLSKVSGATGSSLDVAAAQAFQELRS